MKERDQREAKSRWLRESLWEKSQQTLRSVLKCYRGVCERDPWAKALSSLDFDVRGS